MVTRTFALLADFFNWMNCCKPRSTLQPTHDQTFIVVRHGESTKRVPPSCLQITSNAMLQPPRSAISQTSVWLCSRYCVTVRSQLSRHGYGWLSQSPRRLHSTWHLDAFPRQQEEVYCLAHCLSTLTRHVTSERISGLAFPLGTITCGGLVLNLINCTNCCRQRHVYAK